MTSPTFLHGLNTFIFSNDFLSFLELCGIPDITDCHLSAEDILTWFAGQYTINGTALLDLHIAIICKLFNHDFIIFDKHTTSVRMYSLHQPNEKEIPWIFERSDKLVIPVVFTTLHRNMAGLKTLPYNFRPGEITNPWPLTPIQSVLDILAREKNLKKEEKSAKRQKSST